MSYHPREGQWPIGCFSSTRTKQNKTKQNKTKQNKTKQNKNVDIAVLKVAVPIPVL
jgi:hypothetical protein